MIRREKEELGRRDVKVQLIHPMNNGRCVLHICMSLTGVRVIVQMANTTPLTLFRSDEILSNDIFQNQVLI